MITSLAAYFIGSLALASHVLVGLVLLSGAVRKLRRPSAFAEAVRNYRLLPEFSIPATAIAIMIAELVIGISLLTRPSSSDAGIAAAALLALFAVAAAINLVLEPRREFDCGCGHGEAVSWLVVVRSATLAGVMIVVSTMIAARPYSKADFVNDALFGISMFCLYEAVHGLRLVGMTGSRKSYDGNLE